MADQDKRLASILRRYEAPLLADWMGDLAKSSRSGAISTGRRRAHG